MYRNDYLKLHFLVFLWGFTAILGLLVSLTAISVVVYRTLLASAGLFIVIRATGGKLQHTRKDLLKMTLTGGLIALHWITFFGSARISNASVSLVGFATGSLWTAFLEPLMNKRKIQVYEVLLGLVVIGGLYVIFSFDFRYGWGLLIAVLSGLFSAIFFVLNAQFGRRIDPRVLTFYEMTGAFVVSLFCLILYSIYRHVNLVIIFPGTWDWSYLILLALVCTVYAYTAAVRLMKRLSAFTMQLTINLEPVYGIIFALFIFGDREKMNSAFYVGALMILGAVVSYPLIKKKTKPDPVYELPSQ